MIGAGHQLTKQAEGRGAFYGLLVGIGTIAVVANTTDIHFLWYNAIAAVTVFVVGNLISRIAPAAPGPSKGPA